MGNLQMLLRQHIGAPCKPVVAVGDKVAKGICAPTKLNILEPETYSLYRDLMIMKGIAPAQLKPVHIIRNELQRKFFFSQTEYGVELVK